MTRLQEYPELQAFADTIRTLLPGVTVKQDEPLRPDGFWWLDLVWEKRELTVGWSERTGFGVSRELEPGYGEGPHEMCADAKAAAERTAELLQKDEYTKGPG